MSVITGQIDGSIYTGQPVDKNMGLLLKDERALRLIGYALIIVLIVILLLLLQ